MKKRVFDGIGSDPKLPGGFIDAICETAIALGVAAAICISVISLSAHLNEAQTVRASAADQMADMPANSAGASAFVTHFD